MSDGRPECIAACGGIEGDLVCEGAYACFAQRVVFFGIFCGAVFWHSDIVSVPNDPIQTVRQYMRSAARDGRQRKLCSDFFDRRFRSISGKPGYICCCVFADEGTREGRAAAAEGASNTDCVEIHGACRKER